VNHSIEFKNPETEAYTNNVEGMWRHTKASLSQYCQKKRFYGGYLAKFMFLKLCKILKLDPLKEFFIYTRKLYNPLGAIEHEYNLDDRVSDESDSDSESC